MPRKTLTLKISEIRLLTFKQIDQILKDSGFDLKRNIHKKLDIPKDKITYIQHSKNYSKGTVDKNKWKGV
jgi:hypothetical protein